MNFKAPSLVVSLLAALLTALLTTGCEDQSASNAGTKVESAFAQQVTPLAAPAATLSVEGMTCGMCEGKVKKQIEGLDSVAAVTADSVTGQVEVEFVSGKSCSPADLDSAVTSSGFKLTDIQ